MSVILIADSGSTKCEWCLIENKKKKKILSQGISPYFLKSEEIQAVVRKEVLPKLKNTVVDELYFYGTGLSAPSNIRLLESSLKKVFPGTHIKAGTDILAASRALCGNSKGIACILGTGSNSCYFDGKKITKNSPGLGFILGDEGSGAYLGRKVIQHYLYKTFDEDLNFAFEKKYSTSAEEILNAVYRMPLPNRYLASFSVFLSENRGHFMIENIIEDSFNDFFFQHLCKYRESWLYPVHFTGSIAYVFRDVLKSICHSYEMELGNIYRQPMEGLIKYHAGGQEVKGIK